MNTLTYIHTAHKQTFIHTHTHSTYTLSTYIICNKQSFPSTCIAHRATLLHHVTTHWTTLHHARPPVTAHHITPHETIPYHTMHNSICNPPDIFYCTMCCVLTLFCSVLLQALTEGFGPLIFGLLMGLFERTPVPGAPYLLACILSLWAFLHCYELPPEPEQVAFSLPFSSSPLLPYFPSHPFPHVSSCLTSSPLFHLRSSLTSTSIPFSFLHFSSLLFSSPTSPLIPFMFFSFFYICSSYSYCIHVLYVFHF